MAQHTEEAPMQENREDEKDLAENVCILLLLYSICRKKKASITVAAKAKKFTAG